MNIVESHKFCSHNRRSLFASNKCGCFYCLEIFSPNEIVDWCDENEDGVGQTAICPKCGIDSVLGDNDINFDEKFLKKMHDHWFEK